MEAKKMSLLLEAVADVIEMKDNQIFSLEWDNRDLREKLAKAEAEIKALKGEGKQ